MIKNVFSKMLFLKKLGHTNSPPPNVKVLATPMENMLFVILNNSIEISLLPMVIYKLSQGIKCFSVNFMKPSFLSFLYNISGKCVTNLMRHDLKFTDE